MKKEQGEVIIDARQIMERWGQDKTFWKIDKEKNTY